MRQKLQAGYTRVFWKGGINKQHTSRTLSPPNMDICTPGAVPYHFPYDLYFQYAYLCFYYITRKPKNDYEEFASQAAWDRGGRCKVPMFFKLTH